jgi:hypothetical protein
MAFGPLRRRVRDEEMRAIARFILVYLAAGSGSGVFRMKRESEIKARSTFREIGEKSLLRRFVSIKNGTTFSKTCRDDEDLRESRR